MKLHQPKLFWKEATGETGQEDQTKKGMHDHCARKINAETVRDEGCDIDDPNDPCLSVGYTADEFDDFFFKEFSGDFISYRSQ